MSCRYSICLSLTSPNICSASTSEKPMMAFSGVRSSWLMLARNSLLWLVGDLELAALVLDLVEQARVLDRDHRLVGEGLEQPDLLVGERRHRRADHVEIADARALPSASAQTPGCSCRHPSARRPRATGCRARRRAARRRSAAPDVRPSRAATGSSPPVIGNIAASRSRAVPRCAPRCSSPSSPNSTMPCSELSNRWLQLCRIFSNTGAVSATELLMTAAPRRWRSAARAPPWSR